jgi:hypothetical protein
MPFFRFRQTNSNGFYIGQRLVIIEADSAAEANRLVLEAASDVYFGHRPGDCPDCCGPRWSPLADHEEGDDVPRRRDCESPWSIHYKPRTMGYGVPEVVTIDSGLGVVEFPRFP